MKPLLPLAAILVLLAGCSGDGTQTVAAPEQSASTPAPQPESPQTTTYSTPPPTTPAAQATDADMIRMSPAELKQRVEAGEAIVVDVRSRVAYATEHARGAVNIPLEELGMRAAELPSDKWLVAYCT